MTSAISIMALAFYKQTIALDRDVFSIEEIEAMLAASIKEAASVGEHMERGIREREPAEVST